MSLLMLIAEFNRAKKFTKLEGCERFRCNYCVKSSLPCPVSRQHPNESSTDWQGGHMALLLKEKQTNGIHVGSLGFKQNQAWDQRTCVRLLCAECK